MCRPECISATAGRGKIAAGRIQLQALGAEMMEKATSVMPVTLHVHPIDF